jgi:hypothetical protein
MQSTPANLRATFELYTRSPSESGYRFRFCAPPPANPARGIPVILRIAGIPTALSFDRSAQSRHGSRSMPSGLARWACHPRLCLDTSTARRGWRACARHDVDGSGYTAVGIIQILSPGRRYQTTS